MAKSAITLLKSQHDEAKELLEELESTTDRGVKIRTELLGQLDTALRHHMRIEEEIFYPAFKEAVERKKDKTMYYEAMEEHRAAEKVLKDLVACDVATLKFGGKAKVLKEMIEHHVKEEEAEMFPLAKEVMSKEELEELAERMQARQRELESGRGWDQTSAAAG